MSLRALSWLLVLSVVQGCEKPSGRLELPVGVVRIEPGTPPIDLRADVNRNGTIELDAASEDEGEDTWDAQHGAIFLPNVDDDASRCKTTDSSGRALPDATLPQCHDGTDTEINGDDDLKDLAPLAIKAWPEAPTGTKVNLVIAEAVRSKVRLFRRAGDSYRVLEATSVLATADLQAGLSLLLEGTDIARDSTWDGFVDVTLEVVVPEQKYFIPGTYTDTVRLRVAPVLTFHHGSPVETAFATAVPRDRDSVQFVNEIRAAVASASPTMTLVTPSVEDQWTQDFFETGYASMPGKNGEQHVMRIFMRSANIENPFSRSFPMREAGRVVFAQRGKDTAAIQQVDLDTPYEVQTLNSFGNFETVPPYTHAGKSWPLGRVIRGSVQGYAPDPSFVAMTEAQRYQEPSINVDTSWLLVSHMDETLSFLKVSSPRGWVLLVNDPRLAKSMLEAEVARGNGATRMFIGKAFINDDGTAEIPAETTIQRVLQNAEVMEASAEAAVKVDEQVAILKRETGVTDAEIIKVPFLHEPVQGASLAYQPGTVNMFVIDDKTVAVPQPHGPVVNGVDLFKKQLEDALAPYQYTVRWVENWDLYHRAAGEVHCGTNAMRAIPSTKWWEVQQ